MSSGSGRLGTLALALFVLAVLLALTAAGFAFLNRATPTPSQMTFGLKVVEFLLPLAFLTMPAVGALIIARHPRHLVGWSFLAMGLVGELFMLFQHYGLYGTFTAPGAMPAAGLILWIATWLWAAPTGVLPIILLLFPTGRLPGPGWWPIVVLTVIGTVVPAVAGALWAPDMSIAPFESPITTRPSLEILSAALLVGTFSWSAAMLGAAASLVVRFRRSRGDERQQLKWFVFASAIVACILPVSALTYGNPVVGDVASALSAISVLGLPLAAGVAIRRYRLYDIDLLIRRTLVYGVGSALLLATYVAVVVLLQAVLRPFTAGSDIAVAGSTLLVVALFQPIRARVQDAVDRRFYRSRYDAARTLDAFTAHLRSDVDLDSVRRDLLRVLHETVRPAHASVWLRQTER